MTKSFYQKHFSIKVELISNRPLWQMIDDSAADSAVVNLRHQVFSDAESVHYVEVYHPQVYLRYHLSDQH
ncbi:MAG: hypothetical protein Q4G02_01025 [bacterium]|nr:hypothetical protein [bacterium]